MLRHRLAVPSDFCTLHSEIAPHYGGDALLHSKLPDFWTACLATPATVPLIVEDHSRRVPQVAAWRHVLAIKDSFADELLAGEVRPPVGAEVVRRWMRGDPVWLSPVEIRLANQGAGMRLLTVHIWEAVPKEMPRLYCDVCASQTNGMTQYLKGAKISEVIEDACDEYHSEVIKFIGFTPRAEFECGSWIGNITKADAERNWTMHLAPLFQYRPPRLELSETHREILSLALDGATDEEISERLCLSLSAVKKRWSAVYDHVAEKGLAAGLPSCDGKRGPERRRGLLDYLRWHPEELNLIAVH